MRVLVAAEAFGSLSGHQVGTALATAWVDRGATAAVVPMAAAGGDLIGALAYLWGTTPDVHATELGPISVAVGRDDLAISVALPAKQGVDTRASSRALGVVANDLISRTPATHVVLEVVGGAWHDGGRGWLDAFGGLRAAREQWRDRQLSLVTTAAQATVALTGLRGITSLDGRGADGALALDTATLVRIDQDLAEWAATLSIDPTAAGAGAVGGLGAAVASVGGRVLTGPALIAEVTDLDRTLRQCDLVVTGSEQLDFGSMGGEVLADLIERAQQHLVPLISVSGRNHISPRELRSIGVEAAYSVRDEGSAEPHGPSADRPQRRDEVTADEVTAAAALVAQTWSW